MYGRPLFARDFSAEGCPYPLPRIAAWSVRLITVVVVPAFVVSGCARLLRSLYVEGAVLTGPRRRRTPSHGGRRVDAQHAPREWHLD